MEASPLESLRLEAQLFGGFARRMMRYLRSLKIVRRFSIEGTHTDLRYKDSRGITSHGSVTRQKSSLGMHRHCMPWLLVAEIASYPRDGCGMRVLSRALRRLSSLSEV